MHSPPKLSVALAALLLFVLSACQGPTGPRFPDPTGPKDGEQGDQTIAPFRAPTLAQANAGLTNGRLFALEGGRPTTSGKET
jgi:hypothetical protein